MDRKIIDYLPQYLKLYREFQGIGGLLQPEFEDTWESAADTFNELFISTATSYGLTKWEEMLDLPKDETMVVEDRRFRIIAMLQNQTPYTFRQLVRLLNNLCGEDGYKIELNTNSYTLRVLLALSREAQFDAVENLLREIIPANIDLTVSLEYNRHSTLSRFTHAQLAAYTHQELRSKELN